MMLIVIYIPNKIINWHICIEKNIGFVYDPIFDINELKRFYKNDLKSVNIDTFFYMSEIPETVSEVMFIPHSTSKPYENMGQYIMNKTMLSEISSMTPSRTVPMIYIYCMYKGNQAYPLRYHLTNKYIYSNDFSFDVYYR